MKRAALLILALMFAGCDERMPNEEIIRQSQMCRDAGMTPVVMRDSWTYRPIWVECRP